ncbi:MAG: energy transducer TonB [Bacteroidales bacterium]|nr:energy transducer TonB [Bacteroidales bacterium]
MQKQMITKEEITGMIGAAIFMVLLLVILLFSYFTLAASSDDLGGIPVMFGSMEEAGGYEEPPMVDITPEEVMEIPAPQNRPSEVPLIAQTDEASIVIKEQKRKEEEKERQEEIRREEERRRQAEAERKRREEEARKQEAINKQMSGLFGENSSGNRGQTEGSGTQGVSTGSSNQGATSGTGGIGSYDLGGRSVGSGGLKQPKYTVDEYGTVVVNITVDPRGNVIAAEIGRGTNTGNTSLRQEAVKAARDTKFNAINTPNNQQGTITYKFNLN